MKDTKNELENIHEEYLLLFFENAIRGQLYVCVGKKYVVSVTDTKKDRQIQIISLDLKRHNLYLLQKFGMILQ